mmetsp:Transcript_15006/g.30508  ORF Transcript_15006/g.30508 Transcript_15006/m.30508 type:complete len:111 (-) Transcript_15006:252-584(-)
MAYFQHYRHSMVGTELNETLTEMMEKGLIDDELAEMIWLQFDKAISTSLSKVTNRATMKGPLDHYRNCEGLWTFLLRNARIRFEPSRYEVQVDEKIKVVACDAKLSAIQR